MPPTGRSALPEILDRSCPLPVHRAVNGAPVQPGVVTVAVPDHHLMMVGDRLLISRGPRENGHRPAVDVLFRTAARTGGPRVVAVVLSGALDDGTAGMIAVRERGGVGVAPDPEEPIYGRMPGHAIEGGPSHYRGPGAEMGSILAESGTREVWAASPSA